MKKHLRPAFLTVILMCLVCCRALANNGIGVTLINYTFDTVGLGYTITINAQVTNFDSVPFNGVIDFGLRTDNYILTNSAVFNKPPFSSNTNTITLYPYETVPSIFSVDIDPQYFTPGPDVVVVWPICTQPVVDSIVIPILIEAPNGIAGHQDPLFSYMVLNNRIFIRNFDGSTNLQQVRIYNLMGQQLSTLQSDNITEVPLPALPKGIYLAEFIAANGKRRLIRFFY
ncbi:MAG TPA: T9SS type A sorting domain-containing protein [Chitinophagales bacterium]|nr:T9SS type A sorting domain-containing protein [Chitinophagales bacterium]